MSQNKKLVVNLSETLYNEFNEALKLDSKKRNEFIKEAIILYIEEKKKIAQTEKMKTGYLDMANINLELCEWGINNYSLELNEYETQLSECDMPNDNDNSETRRYILC
ncbi:CopG family transcriptional regulator [Oceanirhabdus seepicola]|uniref:CopG family transcriptional regulator n=1 Tax=Oceanirhabdus seepicola TaxID=2828781 RepID=A0A9J6NXV3_9CLOT|nr:CopG family transcriptional regulator [Oceanirhabdus seepicola]MCM1988461.1 CopG family transcriptional regulator [Oceanirhabdus seepicola]